MAIVYNARALTLLGDPQLDNHNLAPAYVGYAYDAQDADDLGLHPAYTLIWYAEDADPEAIDWDAPDEIQPCGSYDPEARRII